MAANNSRPSVSWMKRPAHSILIVIILLCSQATVTSAQSLLDKRISIKVSNQPLDEALLKIGNLGNFSFSYSPDVIDVKAKVTIHATNQRIRDILDELFKGTVIAKERRKYIILQKNIEAEQPEENFNLNGYIIDGKTGLKLANASIYETVTLASAVSNRYGYYKIRLPASSSSVRLEVRKEEYIGKSIPISQRRDTFLQINLNPDTLQPIAGKTAPVMPAMTDSLHHKIVVSSARYVSHVEILPDTTPGTDTTGQQNERIDYEKIRTTYQKVQSRVISAFASAQQAIHTRNIQDTLYSPFQASVLPFLGTNHGLSGNIVNDYSINLIAGYSLGVNKMELGGILNIVRGNVQGFQLAGISNIVGKDVTGFQYANFLNLTLGNFKGFQGSNLINYTGQQFTGFQVAGVGNVVAGTLNGYQFSTGYNYARTVRSGHQIGFINYADSSSTVPFGLFSFVHDNGYRRYEFSTDEFNYFNTSFKTGVSRFYNIFSLSFNGLIDNKSLGSLGYGFGSAQNLGKGWMLNADLTGHLVFFKDQDLDESGVGMLRFSLSIEKKLGRKFALFTGPSVNLLGGGDDGIIRTSETKGIQPIWLGGTPSQSQKTYRWVGFQAGIRFCN
jgi:hypothetical protein